MKLTDEERNWRNNVDIEVGEYIRTKEGYLGKLIAINKQDYNYLVVDTSRNIRNDEYPPTYLYLKNEDIAKHSKNIIDLIEECDYVNGLEVYKGKVASGKEKLLVGNHIINGMALEIVNIKTILTHEQYERNCYRLEG